MELASPQPSFRSPYEATIKMGGGQITKGAIYGHRTEERAELPPNHVKRLSKQFEKEHDSWESPTRRNSITIFRAGTKEGPSFQTENDDEVWVITDHRLYYLLDKSENVCLWKAVIRNASEIIEEKQSRYKSICKVKLDPKGKKHLEQNLASLPWTQAVVPQKGGGMSLIAKNTLVQAILDYMYYNYPTTPEEFNFQAELKAVCHWRWLEKNELPQFIPGPHDDFRIKRAVNAALTKWKKDLSEAKRLGPGTRKPSCAKKVQNDKKGSDSSSDTDEESISDLEDNIFDLTMYYHKYLTEPECKRSQQGTSQSPHVAGENKEYKAGSKKKMTQPRSQDPSLRPTPKAKGRVLERR